MKPSRRPILARGTTPAGYGYDLAPAADGKAPTEFRIFANGVNTSDKGDFVFDETAAKSVMAAFGKKGAHLTMDYEHQAFNSASNGQPAPNSAKAWTPEVRLDASGKPELWATNVQWTDKAAAMIAAGEYNHFSPAFEAIPKTMRVERIVNMALTNIPALDNQAPLIAASQGDGPMKSMKCKLCQKSLKAPGEDGEDGDEVMCTDHAVIPKMAAVFGLSGASESVLLGAATDATNFRSTVLQPRRREEPGRGSRPDRDAQGQGRRDRHAAHQDRRRRRQGADGGVEPRARRGRQGRQAGSRPGGPREVHEAAACPLGRQGDPRGDRLRLQPLRDSGGQGERDRQGWRRRQDPGR